MTLHRSALPGAVLGVCGLLVGLLAVAADAPVLGAVAGVAALFAGVLTWRLASRLDEQVAIQSLVEAELQAVREAMAGANTPDSAVDATPEAEGAKDAETDSGAADADNALTDVSTGLFSESFFWVALESRVAAARRHLRPVAMVLVEVAEGLPDHARPVEAEIVAETIKVTLREADTACRLQNGYFALLLEDTPENGAIWTVERIRRQLVEHDARLTIWAGVACYPAHAFSSTELMTAAEQALDLAKEWRQDRIEVAAVAD